MALLIVQSREDVAVAKATGATALITPADFLCVLGVGYGAEMQADAAPLEVTFGCGSNAALVHDAIRCGLKNLYADLPAPMFEKLQAIALAEKVRLVADYPADPVDISAANA